MSLTAYCPHCQQLLKLPENAGGKLICCPACKKTFTAPDVLPAAPAEAITAAAPPSDAVQPGRSAPARPEEGWARRPAGEVPDHPPMELRVQLKKDPQKKLKGAFVARLTREGLQLKQGSKHDFLIPPGAGAQHLGGNMLSLTIGDRPVEVHVTKLGVYQMRLAREMAAFLNGERGPLDPKRFRVEWYLLLLALLPIGIPILTLGGLIPALVGGGLFAATFAIVQQERLSVALRVVLALLLVLAGYGVLGCFLGLGLFARWQVK
jgi:hypothetical protein